MTKHKQDQLDGHDPWEVEITYWINQRGIDPDKARTFVIFRWAYLGDLRPLRAGIAEGHHEAVLDTLAFLIDEDRLTVKPRGRGRPRTPDKLARDVAAALLYESRTTDKSEDGFREVANNLGRSHQSIRQAVTQWRKTSGQNAK